MEIIDITKGIIFREIGLNEETSSCIGQKKIYLLQELGVDLSYPYIWYVRGPYSPLLAEYIHYNFNCLHYNDYSQYKLLGSIVDCIKKVNKMDEKKEGLTSGEWYGLIASLLYIYRNKDQWKVSNEDLYEALQKYQPQYDTAQCERAFEVLKQEGFIK